MTAENRAKFGTTSKSGPSPSLALLTQRVSHGALGLCTRSRTGHECLTGPDTRRFGTSDPTPRISDRHGFPAADPYQASAASGHLIPRRASVLPMDAVDSIFAPT